MLPSPDTRGTREGDDVRRLIPVTLAIGLVVAACGGDGGPDAGDATTDLSVNMVEFEFDPSDSVVPAGQEITLSLTNSGSVEHNWVVLDADVRLETEEEFSEDMVLLEENLEPGDALTTTFAAPARGIYQVICTVPGHLTAGMEGRLSVVDG